MSAFVLHDNGEAKSISSGIPPDPVPNGWAAVVITDAEFTGLTSGTHLWDAATQTVQLDTVKAQIAANQQTVRQFIVDAAPTLQGIIDAPQASFTNVSQAQTAVRALQAQVKDLARGMRRVGRMLLDDYSAAD